MTQSSRFTHISRWLAVFGLYLALAVLITWPAVTNLSGAFLGHHTGDSYEMGHHLWWFGYALTHGEPVFTQTLLGYPDGIGGISLWSNPLQFFPAWAFALALPVAAAYNLQVLLTMALNGLTMAFMVTRIGERAGWQGAGRISYPPALIAGAAFLAFPVFQGHLFGGHGGLMVMWPVPLYVDALFALRAGFTRGRFIRAVLWCIASPFGHTLQLIYVLLPITGVFVLAQVFSRDLRGALRTSAAALLGVALLVGIFALPVASDAFDETYTGDLGTIAFSADLLGLATPSFESLLWRDVAYSRAVLGINLIEGLTYYGIVAAVLTAIAVWKRRESRWLLALLIVAAVLALGPLVNIMGRPATLRIDSAETFVTLPWAPVYNLPGFSLARTPGRFSFTVALAAAALVGIGAAALWHSRRGKAVAVALAALLLLDYQSFAPFPSMDATIPAPILALRDRDDVRAVMDMPWGNLLAAKHGMYLQTGHEKPLIAGQVTRRTPVSPAKLTILEQTLAPALMDEAGVDAVILHKQYDDGTAAARLRNAYGAPSFEDEQFALWDVPDAPQAPTDFVAIGEADAVSFTSAYDLIFYSATAGLVDFTGQVGTTGAGAKSLLRLDGDPILRWSSAAETPLHVPLFVEAGYHTLSLAFESPCPTRIPGDILYCAEAHATGLTLTPQTLPVAAPVTLGNGVVLQAAAPSLDHAETDLSVHLLWQFDAPRSETDVRFVKLLTPDGADIGGADSAPGAFAAGDSLAETVGVALPDGFTGEVEVYVGWYSYPDIVRFPVQGDGKRAQDGLVYIGTVTVR